MKHCQPECAEPAAASMVAHEQRRRIRHYQELVADAEQLFPPGDPADDLIAAREAPASLFIAAYGADARFERATGESRR